MNAAVRVATPTAVLLLAVTCALAGGLSHHLGQAQGYATPIWLPAGIALGAMLVAGMQVWPGVWLGIFAITAYQLGGTLSVTAIAASAAAIATGATLQAALGAYLAQRYAGAVGGRRYPRHVTGVPAAARLRAPCVQPCVRVRPAGAV